MQSTQMLQQAHTQAGTHLLGLKSQFKAHRQAAPCTHNDGNWMAGHPLSAILKDQATLQ